ncbi:MAG: GAF domain-containing protein [Anaerolineae bacterium]|nr:GAF domain-containing protein [Anaerolineae bacterium]
MERGETLSSLSAKDMAKVDGLLAQITSEQRTRLVTYLRRYVAPSTAMALFDDGKLLSLLQDHDVDKATVMLGDLRGFVASIVAQERSARGLDRIYAALGRYVARVTEVIFKHGGVFFELAGDQFIGVFGAYIPDESDALRAVVAATEIAESKSSFSPLSENGIGIAVCTGGKVRIGDIPSRGRAEFAVIGSLISRSSRVQDVIKKSEYRRIPGLEIYLDDETYEAVAPWVTCESIGSPKLRSLGRRKLYKLQAWHRDPSLSGTDDQTALERVNALASLVEGFSQRRIAQGIRGAFAEVARTLSAGLDLDETLASIIESVGRIISADKGSVWLWDEVEGRLEPRATLDPSELSKIPSIAFEMDAEDVPGEGIIVWVVRHREAALVEDAQVDPRFSEAVDKAAKSQTRSVLCVPMIAQDRSIGAIELIDEKETVKYTSEDLDLLASIATSAAIAVQNTRHYGELEDSYRALEAARERETEIQRRELRLEKLAAMADIATNIVHKIDGNVGLIDLKIDRLERSRDRGDLVADERI